MIERLPSLKDKLKAQALAVFTSAKETAEPGKKKETKKVSKKK